MNILILTNHLNTGGVSSYCLTLASGLKKMGNNVFIASSEGDLVSRFQVAGIGFESIPIKTKAEISPKIIRSYLKLKPFIRDKKIDIIHANTRVTQVLAALIQKRLKVPFISTCHGFFKVRILRKLFPCWGDKVIAISQQVREHLSNDFKVKETDIVTVHNGIDVARFINNTPEEKIKRRRLLGLKEGPVIGIVARLSIVKGHSYLVEAMKIVLEQNPQAQLIIAGEGKLEKQIKKQVNSLGIEKNVYFVPTLTDTRDVLWALDIFVLPSINEGLGLALMEAMASGLAVIGSDVGGIKTLIENNERGLLTKVADSKNLAEAINSLIKDQAKQRLFGEKAKKFIVENFSQDSMCAQTLEVYKLCVSA